MKKTVTLLPLLLLGFSLAGCGGGETSPNYSEASSWVRFEDKDREKVDTFFLAPTASSGDGNMNLSDSKLTKKFVGTVAMEEGIYTSKTRFFAPFYREALLGVYNLPGDERKPYLDKAYADVKNAFTYYLENVNKGNRIILAGFSQGADMTFRLLRDFAHQESFYSRFVAAYVIGWHIYDEDLVGQDRLKMAKGEDDTKVIISFDCEAEGTTSTLAVPEGKKTNSINPLNWKTDGTPGTKEENLGAVFLNSNGNITETKDHFCGGYIHSTRGTLVCPDVDKEKYNQPRFGEGSYHPYDYQFFYKNLQHNVEVRIDAVINN